MLALDEAARRFDHALATVDTQAAVSLVDSLLDDGAEPVDVLVDVIAAGQREVGRRWQRGEWSVAQEHAATAVSVSATEAVATRARRVPVTRGRVVVACAEREWHALPAMIIGCAMRAAGWDATLLGASTPSIRLNQYLHDIGPDATAVSCSVLGSLPAARRFVEASTASGVPVVVGGSAFGSDGARAAAIGATAWAPGAREAITALDTLPTVVRPAAPLPAAAAAEQAAIELARHRIVDALRERWSLAAHVLTDGPSQLDGVQAVARDVVAQALHAVSAALVTGDARVLPETSAWVAEVLVARGAEARLVAELGDVLADGLRDHPIARRLVEDHWAGGLVAPVAPGPA